MKARVLEVGAAAPHGMNSLQAAMSARAGLLAPRSSPFRDRRGIPIAACWSDWLDDTTTGPARWLQLLLRAAAPVAERIRPETPLLLVAPASEPDAARQLLGAFVTALRGRLCARTGALVPGGAAAPAHAVERAIALLAAGAREVAVACVDSLFDPRALAALDDARRLRSDAAEEALVPGEGAAFLLLGPATTAEGVSVAVATGAEQDDPDIGRCWTSLVRRVGAAPLSWVLTNLNGERHRARPWAMVRQRVSDLLEEPVVEEHAGDLFADAGAATGALLLAACVERWRTSCAPAGSALIALAGDGVERGALLLSRDGASPSVEQAAFTACAGVARVRRAHPGPPVPPPRVAAHLRAMAREHAEDIGALGMLRAPGRDQGWRTAEPFERRLLARFDALAALGEAGRPALDPAEYVRGYRADAFVPDPARAFAHSFVLGCSDHPAAPDQIAAAIKADPPDLHETHAQALALAARPGLGAVLASLLTGPAAALALDVLRRRREVTCARCLVMLEHADPSVVAAAARALGFAPAAEAKAARAVLEDFVTAPRAPEIELVAAESLARLGSPRGASLARERLSAVLEAPGAPRSPRVAEAACRLLSVAGAPADADLLARASTLLVPALEALGWLGDRRHVDLLLDRLEVLGEVSHLGSVPVRRVAEALARLTGLTVAREDSTDHQVWRALWAQRAAEAPPGARLRSGRPFSVDQVVEALEDAAARPADRELSHLELHVLTGLDAFEPTDWVARQTTAIAAIAARSRPGGRPSPGRRPT